MTILNESDHGAAAKARSKHLTGHQPIAFRGQRGAILNKLIENKGREVPAYALAEIALQYCGRVAELRRLHYVIENRTERIRGQVHGYYKLVSEPGETRVGKEQPSALFDDTEGLSTGADGVGYAYPD